MILELHEKIKSKKISALELIKHALKSIKINQKQNNAYISILDHHAELKSKQCDEWLAQKGNQPTYLHGIPFSLKDLFITKGIRTTAGSAHLANYVPPYDGHVSEKLQNAQGILVGKTGCDEFGMGSTNENTPFGAVSLPGHPQHVAGGSSGGSAASVAEGSSLFSIGTDTGGSVRLPASFCGLVGFKPSYGVVSRYGQIAYASSLDQSSPLAIDVSDIAVVMEELAKKDSRDATQVYQSKHSWVDVIKQQVGKKGLQGKTIGFDPKLWNSCDPEVQEVGVSWMKHFHSMGIELVEIPMPSFEHAVSTYYLVAPAEASANLARYDGVIYGYRTPKTPNLESLFVKSRSESLGEEVKRRILIGTFALSSGYSDDYFAKASKVRRLIWNDFKNAFQKCDFYFTPVCASTAFLQRKFNKIPMDPLKDYMNDIFTIPVNLAGVPAIALPTGVSTKGLPLGMQLIGPTFSDQELLGFARNLELELPIYHGAKNHWKDFL